MLHRFSSLVGTLNRNQPETEVKRRRLKPLIDEVAKGSTVITNERYHQRSVAGRSPCVLELSMTVRMTTGTTKVNRWILKAIQENPKAPMTTRYDVHTRMTKEIAICSKLFDAIGDYQKRVGIETTYFNSLFPHMVATRLNLTPTRSRPDRYCVIIYDDLDPLGYHFENACTGFDLPTAELLVKNLAFMHAIPIAMRLKNIFQFKESVMHMLNEVPDGTDIKDHYKQIYRDMRLGLDNQPELEPHMEKIQAWIELSQKFSWTSKVYDTLDWFTICHPRYSIRNIMVKRNEDGMPTESKILEPHRLEFNTGVKDLVYFMCTSIGTALLRDHFDDIIDVYHDHFITILLQHNVEIEQIERFSKEKLMNELNAMAPYTLADILYTLRTIICDGFDAKGEPILDRDYRVKFKDIILLFIAKQWITEIPTDPRPPGGPQPPGEPPRQGDPQGAAEIQIEGAQQALAQLLIGGDLLAPDQLQIHGEQQGAAALQLEDDPLPSCSEMQSFSEYPPTLCSPSTRSFI
ncbi:uncharacterized protein LOC109543152 [Dendroctonus ponderosae]|uniref:CHK kinase-like domain-containing protein n=1 Tax=Dendroctonus ponderosae TaxID=77166 RepID=A0AAR5Q4Y5_DENPD|nr:uncharacterized protein LOC109543152 [Dendroctonus ponderosae]KAH1005912.1 hypothetical protein HUJ04_006813 [Dendroctonus ponderosae]KAH1013047.1 hypothetical protein HUJ05_012100 [Dendroctonus ponderosae]